MIQKLGSWRLEEERRWALAAGRRPVGARHDACNFGWVVALEATPAKPAPRLGGARLAPEGPRNGGWRSADEDGHQFVVASSGPARQDYSIETRRRSNASSRDEKRP